MNSSALCDGRGTPDADMPPRDKIKGIVNRKVQDGELLYKVKYKDNTKEPGWLAAEDLDSSMIATFERAKSKKKRKETAKCEDEEANQKRQKNAPAAPPLDLLANLKSAVSELLSATDMEEITKKKVRRSLEQKHNLPANTLDAHKAEINKAVDDYVEAISSQPTEAPAAQGGDDESASDESDSNRADDSVAARKPKITIQTITGEDAPRMVAKAQSRAMTASHFYKHAQPLEVNVMGNVVSGEPRDFSSGNKGWYLGGKVQVKIGKKTVWASLGLNLTICGSKSWS